MDGMNLRELQAPIKRRYEEDPEAARITMTVRSGPSDLSDPLHVAIVPDAAPAVTWAPTRASVAPATCPARATCSWARSPPARR